MSADANQGGHESQAMHESQNPNDRVFVLDELELRPGKLDAFLAAFETGYLPAARARGMTLLHRWVTPPLELPEGGSSVLLVWSLSGPAGFWTMRSQSGTEEVAQWWRHCDGFITRRSRRLAAEASALPRLEAAGKRHA